jgi:hypothetical protein
MRSRAGRWLNLVSPKKVIRASAGGARLGWKVQGILGEVVLDRCGNDFRRGLQVLNYVAAWGLFFEIEGEGPTTDRRLDEVVNVPYATGSRWKRAFRQTFPELEDPGPLWEQVKAGVQSESVDVAMLQVGASTVDLRTP